MRKTKGFSYDPEKDRDIINHINKQPNGSQYIWELVRKDMNSNSIEEIVKQQIEKYLHGINIPAGIKSIDIDKNDIKDILDL